MGKLIQNIVGVILLLIVIFVAVLVSPLLGFAIFLASLTVAAFALILT